MVSPVKYDLVVDEDMGADIIGDPYNLVFMLLFSIQAQWSGNPVGTVTLEASNDQQLWTPISGASQTTDGVPGSVMFAYVEMAPFPWIRIKYNRGSGSGTFNATINAKGG